MSNIRLYGSTSGNITVSAANVAGNNTITLPAETGETLIKDSAGNVNVTSINSGPLAGFRNAIINGNFDIWQRGDTHSSSGYGSADRWALSIGGSSATVTKTTFTNGQIDVPNNPKYYCNVNVTSVAGAANYAVLLQRIEGAGTFAGKQVSFSLWAKSNSGSKYISIELAQIFGSGGTPSDFVSYPIGKYLLTSTWQKITGTTTLSTVNGKTFGSNGNDRLSLLIWFDAGSDNNSRTSSLGQQSGSFDISQVQVEEGPVATNFELRPKSIEELLCYRYCIANVESQPLGGGSSGQMYNTAGGSRYAGKFTFPVRMRSVPTVTYDTSAIAYSNCSALTSSTIRDNGLFLFVTVTATGNYSVSGYKLTADAEINQ